jgi:predicted solute-binding protein
MVHARPRDVLPDLLDGRVDMALDSLPAYIPHLKAGRLRALAVAYIDVMRAIPSIIVLYLIGFGLPALPTGCAVQSATLRLHLNSLATDRLLEASLQDPELCELCHGVHAPGLHACSLEFLDRLQKLCFGIV